MRASRLLTILLLLHTRGRVSAQQLADELEVSPRTVYRDVEALGSAGIPVYATRGRAGGFQLLDGYRTKLTGLTAAEADTLFLAGLPGAASDLGLGGGLAATQLKLLAALPPELRARAETVRDRFHLDAPGWERRAESPAALGTIADAVWRQHRVRVRYERADHSHIDRLLEPLGLVLKAGVWYVVAAVPADEHGPRTYRLSRILSADLTGDSFPRPDEFDLPGFWTSYQRDYEQRLFRSAATIRLSPAGRRALFLVGSGARAGYAAMREPDEDGWALTTLPIESVAHAAHQLAQLGADVEVVEPAELRERIAATARAVLDRYESAGRGSASSPERDAGPGTSRDPSGVG